MRSETSMASQKSEPASDLQRTIDEISLEQALLDADVAITRAHDLALRLVELSEQLADAREENMALRSQAAQSQALYDEIVQNRAYGLASKVWAIRRAVGG
jgi:chromosome condensin MukBEF ATPase and DNA-binding subunit MukB